MVEVNTLIIQGMAVAGLLQAVFIFRLRQIQGNIFNDYVAVLFGKIKNPAPFVSVHGNRRFKYEIRDSKKPQYLNNNDPSSQLMEIKSEKGFVNNVGWAAYILTDKATTNVDPLDGSTNYIEPERAGQLVAKVLDIEEGKQRYKYREKILTKDEYWKGTTYIIVGIVVIAFLLWNMQGFIDTAQKTFDSYKPFIDQALGQIPHIEPVAPPKDPVSQIIDIVQPQK